MEEIHPYCLICKTRDRVLVRDHCHKTMVVRGVLCDRCNSWIGILENTPHVLDTLTVADCTSSYKLWIVQYHSEIIKHLNRKTKYKWQGCPSIPIVMQANLDAEGIVAKVLRTPGRQLNHLRVRQALIIAKGDIDGNSDGKLSQQTNPEIRQENSEAS